MKKRKLLFRIQGCPYCVRAEQALDKKKVAYEKVEVDPSDRSIVELLSGQSTVPVLVEVIGCEDQDDDILEYLEEI